MGTMSNFEAMVTKKHDLELEDKKEKMIQGVVSRMQKKLAEPEPELLVDDLNDDDVDDDDIEDDFVDMPSTPAMKNVASKPKNWSRKNANVREDDLTDIGNATLVVDDSPVRLEPVNASSVDPVPKATADPARN